MQYLNYALQTSTRLLTYQGHHNQSNQDLYPAGRPATAHEEEIAHACCSRGAQLLRLRQRELAKRRALEDQINANQQNEEQEEEEETEHSQGQEQEQDPESDQGAVGGEHLPQQPVQ
ncbi:nuclear receptor coactivator 2-like [Drosophila bipectinata]|uniref:nuclear receptor coactivator 2-like n=1 Tax=Drosophila bipectinata TaxID=42026 RepID=UPI001C88F4D2|nr:probable serine/threonine-protein kinase yakA [Drosophila bipectinata]XP_017106854.2 probable serine/threonine-protein kinase yakA [Drosophila bipectinata]XP_017106855.2 probable serine/threonine-protein kinase yakA [Drosophila bipectinata]XP_043066998.1 probable serine/threonine-protein kinase yakA [Drosophila bipectinata]